MIESALEWQLKLLRWQLFATLTWEQVELTSINQRRRHVCHWLKVCAARFCLTDVELVAQVTRWERGEIGDRPHCHLLIAGLPKTAIHLTTCFRMKHAWEHKPACSCGTPHRNMCGRGIAQVRLYEPSRNGEAYMTKGKFSYAWAQGANAYELKKFNSQELDALYISPRAMQMMVERRAQVGNGSC